MGINRNKVLSSALKHVHKGNWDKAIAQYQLLVNDDSRDVRSMLKIADLYSKLGKNDQALNGYQQVAQHYASDEIFEKAAAVYKQALRLAPESPDLHRDLGDAYHSLGRLKDAVRAYHQAQKIYKSRGDAARQTEVLERMIALDPDDIGMRIQLAERYAKDNEVTRALEFFEFAAERLDQEGRTDEFVQVAERIIFLRDDAPDLRRRVIDIYLSNGQYRHALSHLQVCFKREPQNPQILDRLSQAFERLDRGDKAVLVLHELANLPATQANERECEHIYERILAIQPDDARALKRLRRLRKLSDAGTPTGVTHTNPSASPKPARPGAQSDADALAGVEFLDETSGIVFLDGPEDANPGAPEPVDISNDLEELEVVAPTIERTGEDDSTAAVARVLKETEVFIKYGLFDKAYETIVSVIARYPNNLHARAQMAQLQEARNNPEGAVDEFLEMARITRATPRHCQKFVREAFALTNDSERVRRLADQLGVPLEAEQSTATGHEFGGLDAHSLAESTANDPDSRSQDASRDQHLPLDDYDYDEDEYSEDEASHTDRMVVTDDMLAMNLEDLELIDEGAKSFDEPGTQELDLDDDALLFADQPVAATEDHAFEVLDDDAFDFDEAELMDADLIELEIDDAEFIDADMLDDELDIEEIEDMEFDGLDFDESAFEGAELLEMDVDIEGLSELSDSQMGALQDDNRAGAAGNPEFDLSVTDAEADQMFDQLFGDSGAGFGGLGEETSVGESSGLDFFGNQHGFDEVSDVPPSGPTLRRSSDSGGPAHQDFQIGNSEFGARSLSGKFVPAAEFEQSEGVVLGEDEAHNTSLELGLAYRDMGLFDEAILEFTHALDDPDARDAATYHIALCEIELGKQTDAVERLQALLLQSDLAGPIRQAALEQLQGSEA